MEILDLTAKALMWNYSTFDIRGLFENEWILLDFETRELIIFFSLLNDFKWKELSAIKF